MSRTKALSAPPAPAPVLAPPRVIFMRCTENRVEDDADGGIVLFQATRGQLAGELVGCNFVASFKHDEPMRAYPVTKDDKRRRFFRVTLEEIPESEVPTAPEGV